MDVDPQLNVSLWLVERGYPISCKNKYEIAYNVPITASSIIFEFEVIDKNLGEKRSPMFFSFAHDTH